jgi:hypothetical protein
MDRIDLLKQMSFGVQVAETKSTRLQVTSSKPINGPRFAKGDIDIVRGEKGAGKSAIYSLLMTKVGSFFDARTLLVAAENPRGATVFKDLVADPPTTENEFIALWKLYALAIVAQELREYDVRGAKVEKIQSALEGAKLLEREFSLRGLLRSVHEYARRIVAAEQIEGGMTFDPATQMPTGITGKIVLKEPSADLRAKGFASIDSLFSTLNEALEEANLKVWVLLDRLDVAFVDNHELEANALRALIRAYADIRNLGQISLKIFLREDIWKRITEQGLREASHLIRYVILDWPQPALLNLIMRRLLKNDALVKEFQIDVAAVLQDAAAQEALFYRFFPKQVEQGPQKAPTFKWLITRCADGTGKTAPREVIHLLNCIRDEEIRRLENGGAATQGDQLFDRSVFKVALPTVSGARLNQYLYAEYPGERPLISKLEGQKAEQTPESLAALWALPRDKAIAEAKKLVELGFFEERGTREEPTYWVPFLYRDALNLVQGKADAHD